MVHGLCAVGRTAAGGDNVMVNIDLEDFLLLNCPQCEMIAFIDDLLQGLLLIDLDEDIGIDKPEAEILGQDYADGAFAGSRHPDKCQV